VIRAQTTGSAHFAGCTRRVLPRSCVGRGQKQAGLLSTPGRLSPKLASMTTTYIGYARVSTDDQDPQLQVDALSSAGCLRVFTDTASGSLASRPELDKMLDQLRPGDVVTVWRLDRLGRSLHNLIALVDELSARGIGFRSLTESIDTTTTGGRFVLHIFAALAEMERDLIRERTVAGLASARARGRVGGRPPVMTADKLAIARQMMASGDYTVSAIASALGVSRKTIYRHLGQVPAP
jgi:DNA invertase Pin-like site-specific DNA recombinase